MSYNYQTQRENVFTEHGQKTFLSIRDRAKRLITASGCATMGAPIAGEVGNSWDMLA